MDREKKGRMGSPARRFFGEAVLVINVGGFPMICDGKDDMDDAWKRMASSYK
jgi:hypothetical protein